MGQQINLRQMDRWIDKMDRDTTDWWHIYEIFQSQTESKMDYSISKESNLRLKLNLWGFIIEFSWRIWVKPSSWQQGLGGVSTNDFSQGKVTTISSQFIST